MAFIVIATINLKQKYLPRASAIKPRPHNAARSANIYIIKARLHSLGCGANVDFNLSVFYLFVPCLSGKIGLDAVFAGT